jgi:RND superfamily putative drug exporter
MFERLAHFLIRRRKAALALSLIALLVLGSIGTLLFSRMQSSGYSDPGSESARVWTILQDDFKIEAASVVLIVDSKKGDATSNSAEALALEKKVAAQPGVDRTVSYWSAGNRREFLSKDGKAGYIFVFLSNSDEASIGATSKVLQKKFDGDEGNLRVYATGFGVFSSSVNDLIKSDLAKSESIAIPLTFVLLILVFGSLVASGMPLLVGLFAIMGAFFGVWLISLFADVSIFALNLITGLGLGLGIDYALLMVNRFREELHAGKDVEEAVVRTVSTAGRTFFFSGLTVAFTLGSLVLFPQYFLKSFAYAALAVVFMAVVAALVPLPAMLAILGHKVDKGVVRRSSITPKEDGGWSRIARLVMHRPVRVAVVALLFLGVLILPLKGVLFSQADERVLPASNKAAIAAQVQQDRFAGAIASPIQFLIPAGSNESDKYTAEIAQQEHIVAVIPGAETTDYIQVQAVSDISPRTPAGENQILKLREIPAPSGTLIGGVAADYADSQGGIKSKLPIVVMWIVIAVLLLLFMFTGSIMLPFKAIVLNFISLGATIGVMKWIFVDGHLNWLVGSFTNTGTLDTSMLVLVAVTTFGLSMDYELFLLSRIKEEHDSGKGTVDSVAIGLQRSARIITAAAALLAIIFASFILSGVTSIKILGFGVAFAILLDATIIRALLVPALMRLFGEKNWWAPKALKRFTVDH